MDFTPIFQALLSVLALLITGYLIPWLKKRLNSTQQECLNRVVSAAVMAAEQVITGDGRGAERKEYVLGILASKGVKVNDAVVDAAIEAAVYKMKQGILA